MDDVHLDDTKENNQVTEAADDSLNTSVNESLQLFNPLSTNPTKWSNTLKQFVGNLPTNCLSVFDHFMNLALKGLNLRY